MQSSVAHGCLLILSLSKDAGSSCRWNSRLTTSSQKENPQSCRLKPERYLMTPAPCQASWHPSTIEYRDARAPQIQPATNGPRGTMPKSRHRKNAPARPHHAGPRGIHARARKMTHMTHHDTPPGDAKPQMTQNDSHFQAPNPEMTQNDSVFQASMPQMSQNDSHIEVFSFEMSQNDSFSGHKYPTEHPLSVADEPPATPPSPQNDTPEGDPSAAVHPFAAGPLPPGHFPGRFGLPSATCHPERNEESNPHQ